MSKEKSFTQQHIDNIESDHQVAYLHKNENSKMGQVCRAYLDLREENEKFKRIEKELGDSWKVAVENIKRKGEK